MECIVAPSLLAADFNNLSGEIEMINKSEADWLHLDIMDGVFVPNISFGMPILKHVRKICKKKLDVHLMIIQPERYVEEFADVGADIITVHYEACNHLNRVVQQIKNKDKLAGVTINPHTSVQLLKDIMPYIDMVLLMSVNPGFGGQEFISNTYSKLSELQELKAKYNNSLIIQVDGGISSKNAKKLKQYGANSLVAGSAIFSNENPLKEIHDIKYL
ncbi:MAG: ribulose-phosphate 3-epimerase [Bacteroidales bacterium]|nr:ribulose-phosphate 3-epimerase [Bacteroidales bacterium]MDD4235673.1 ribulose-phosphate 3-epimerase [Bacteroidales bacterium]